MVSSWPAIWQTVVGKKPHWHARVTRVAASQSVTIPCSFEFSFLYGLRNISPFAIALSDISWFRFFCLNGIAAAPMGGYFFIGGYVFGRGLAAMLGHLHVIQVIILGIIIGGIIAV